MASSSAAGRGDPYRYNLKETNLVATDGLEDTHGPVQKTVVTDPKNKYGGATSKTTTFERDGNEMRPVWTRVVKLDNKGVAREREEKEIKWKTVVTDSNNKYRGETRTTTIFEQDGNELRPVWTTVVKLDNKGVVRETEEKEIK